MSEELYITGPVILNGIPDDDGDTLDSVEIRTIFTKYTEHLSDIQHNYIDQEGVDVLANWISENETTIAGNTIPAKSWLATVKVTDPETLKAITNGELTGFSLGSVSSKAKTREAWFINKRISYHDLKSIEDVIPLRISIVDKGANGYPFEISDYLTYINKNEEGNMTDEGKFSLNDIKGLFGLKKEIQDEVMINKAEEAPVETPAPSEPIDAEKSIDTLFEMVTNIANDIAEIKAALASEPIDKAEEEEEEPKPEEEAAEEEAKPEKEEEEEKVEKSETETDSETEIQKEAETKIEKSTQKAHDIPVSDNTGASNFYKNTNRDHFGRKIRN